MQRRSPICTHPKGVRIGDIGHPSIMLAVHSRQENPRQGKSENVDGNIRIASNRVLVSRLVSSLFFSSPWCPSTRVSWLLPLIYDSFFSICIPGWIESSRQECTKSHSHSLVSSNSHLRISPNALGESV